jgi:serine/threonine protein kinase
MSPEQLEASGSIDHRSDIWALGVIAFECLVGHLPFQSDTFPGLVLDICSRALQRAFLARAASGELRRLVLSRLCAQPERALRVSTRSGERAASRAEYGLVEALLRRGAALLAGREKRILV